MKILKILLVSVGALSLFACNIGDDTSTTTQNINGTSPISLSGLATGCTQSSGTCNITINYIANNGSSSANQSIYYRYGSNLPVHLTQSGGSNCSSIPSYNGTPATCNASINIISGSQQTITFYAGPTTVITNGDINSSINIGSN